MYRQGITIETKPEREGQKSRSFSVDLLCWVLGSDLWEMGATSKERCHRPVFLAYAGTEQASRAFTANLKTGRPAVFDGSAGYQTRIEVPRSAGFRYDTFSHGNARLTCAYLPSAFAFQPGTTELEMISFICMPPRWWVEREATLIEPEMGADAREAAMAAYFVAFLNRRSPLPIADDLRFHLGLYRAAKKQSWCVEASSGSEWSPGKFFHLGTEGLGFEPPILCKVGHPTFAEFLASQTALLLPPEKEVIDHGAPRIRSIGRVLPNTGRAATQLGLFAQI